MVRTMIPRGWGGRVGLVGPERMVRMIRIMILRGWGRRVGLVGPERMVRTMIP